MDSSYCFHDGYAACGVAIQEGDADLEFGDLTVSVSCHEVAAPADLYHPSSFRRGLGGGIRSSFGDRGTEVFRNSQGFTFCN